MLRSWRVGSAFGIGIYVHWTFLLLAGLVFVQKLGQGDIGLAFYSAMLFAGVFTCVILHELGHALMAKVFGIATKDITLYPIGGVARLERMTERPVEELMIALAGPAVNVIIAFVLMSFLFVVGHAIPLALEGPSRSVLLSGAGYLLLANIILVLFNMVPAFPMDGGRVLRALLAMRLGRLRATEIAAKELSTPFSW
jgi:Zn-dependent protease